MIKRELKMTPGTGFILLKKGEYSFNQLYKKGKEWIDERKYDLAEKEFSRKMKVVIDETKVNWIAERNIDDHAKFVINTWIISKDQNKNLSACKGEVKVTISGKIVFDYNEKWTGSRFLSIMLPIYNTFIIKKKMAQYKSKIWNELMEYVGVMKKELKIYD